MHFRENVLMANPEEMILKKPMGLWPCHKGGGNQVRPHLK